MQPDDNWQKWFERVWQYREEELYPSLFGPKRQGIFTLQADMLTGTFKQESIDPRWLHYGVFEFAPAPTRNSWLYVTSGMSNDWEADRPDNAKEPHDDCRSRQDFFRRDDDRDTNNYERIHHSEHNQNH